MAVSSSNKVQEFYACNVIIPVTVFTLIVFLLIVFKSVIWVLIAGCLYITSIFYGLVVLQYVGVLLVNLIAIKDTFNPTYEVKDPCTVCSNNNCKRHKLFPHSVKVKIPKDFDYALEQLLEDLLQKYICAWYSSFSTNKAFVQQLRVATTTATKNLVVRLLRTDVANIVLCRLVPLILQNAEDWKTLRTRIQDTSDASHFRKHVIGYLGHEIHPAAYSREAELNYLKGLVTAVVPHLLPAIHVSTNNKVLLREILANWILLPAVDAIADPDNINALVLLLTQHDGTFSNDEDAVNVQMLQCWLTNPLMSNVAKNHLKPSLDQVLNNPRLFYMFIQHVKDVGPMNLLQFCLDIDDLSKRMLNPDISEDDKYSLYTDIQNMYSMYLDPEGPEYLYLPEDISIGIQQILDRGEKKIDELRTSRPFYQAHQEAHALLESTCLPSFHHSYQLYALLCGQPTPNHVKQPLRTNAVSGITNASVKSGNHFPKFDGVLRASAIDGMPFEEIYQGEEIDYPSLRSYSEIIYADDSFHRDLTTWRVSIPHIDSEDSQTLYMIAVHNVAEEKSWTVLRRDQDFYALRTRLAEFHGDKELSDSPLPSRKNPHFSCAVNRQRYEDFLEKLLSKPVLRSSELLYTFLTMPNLKPYFANYTPDIGILYQNMAYKLQKEKGQNLDKFMTIFLSSTNLKSDYTDVGIEISNESDNTVINKRGRHDLLSGVFGNNLHLDISFETLSSSSLERSHVKGASFCIANAVDRLLNISPIITRVFWMFASSTRAQVDPFVNILLYNALVKVLSNGRAAAVVKLLHAKVMGDKNYTKELTLQKSRRNYYENAKKGLHNLLPYWLIGFYRSWIELTDSVLDSLQNATLNKHLTYVLLDHILISLFPELTL